MKVKLPYDPAYPSVDRLVGRMVCHNFLKGQEVSLSMLLSGHLFRFIFQKQEFGLNGTSPFFNQVSQEGTISE